MPMRTYSRKEVFLQKLRFSKPQNSKILQRKNVMVKDPDTGFLVEKVVTTYVDEPLIDSHLRSSDYDLDVQLRNKVPLTECPSYLSPSSPEQFEAVLQNHVNLIDCITRLGDNPIERPQSEYEKEPKTE